MIGLRLPGALLAAAILSVPVPVTADLLQPSPDRRDLDLGGWTLWCTIARPAGTVTNCSIATGGPFISGQIMVYGGRTHYSMYRYCIAGGEPTRNEYRSGLIEGDRLAGSSYAADLDALAALPVHPTCGKMVEMSAGLLDRGEAAIAILRTLVAGGG